MNVFDHIFSRLVMVSVCCGISNFVLFSANSKWSSVTYHSTLRKYFKNLINLITGCDLINITFGCMHFFAMAARKSPVQNYINQSSDSQGRTLFRTFWAMRKQERLADTDLVRTTQHIAGKNLPSCLDANHYGCNNQLELKSSLCQNHLRRRSKRNPSRCGWMLFSLLHPWNWNTQSKEPCRITDLIWRELPPSLYCTISGAFWLHHIK